MVNKYCIYKHYLYSNFKGATDVFKPLQLLINGLQGMALPKRVKKNICQNLISSIPMYKLKEQFNTLGNVAIRQKTACPLWGSWI